MGPIRVCTYDGPAGAQPVIRYRAVVPQISEEGRAEQGRPCGLWASACHILKAIGRSRCRAVSRRATRSAARVLVEVEFRFRKTS